MQPLLPGTPGLVRAVDSVQQPAARQTELTGHGTRQQLGLIETSLACAGSARGCPGDHADPVEFGPWDTGDDERGEAPCHRSPPPVLEGQDDVARHSLEPHGSQHSRHTGRCDHRSRLDRSLAARADDVPGFVATGTEREVDHGLNLAEGCAPVSRSVAAMFLPLPTDRHVERILRCVAGLACFGLGISMFLTAELGVAPWDILHQGISRRSGLPIGVVIEITGVVILLLWIPLRERMGWGTLMNAVEIGLVVLLIGDHLPHTDRLIPRLAYVVGAVIVIAVGSGLYIGAGLGPGPRDGLMLGLSKRGVSVRVARTGVEATVLVIGVALGGEFGIGTLAFTFGIGPAVQFFLPRLRLHATTASSSEAVATG